MAMSLNKLNHQSEWKPQFTQQGPSDASLLCCWRIKR